MRCQALTNSKAYFILKVQHMNISLSGDFLSHGLHQPRNWYCSRFPLANLILYGEMPYWLNDFASKRYSNAGKSTLAGLSLLSWLSSNSLQLKLK